MAESTHRVEVVRVSSLQKHPNADSLSIAKLGGFTVIVKSSEWNEGDLAAYVQPDSLVPLDREEFSWLRETGRSPVVSEGRQYHLVRTVRLRKLPSMGLLLHAPADAVEGQDLADYYGVLHYEPAARVGRNEQPQPRHGRGGDREPTPTVKPPVYDLENLRRYTDVFQAGEPVVVTEKIHGANARFTSEDRGFFSLSWRNGIALRLGTKVFTWGRGRGFKVVTLPEYARHIRVGSRTQWRKPDPNCAWWRALANSPQVAGLLRGRPGWTLYGEIYGDVQDLDYSVPNDVRFIAFDLRDDKGEWVPYTQFKAICDRYKVVTVPVLYEGPFDLDKIIEYAEGQSPLARAHNFVKALNSGLELEEAKKIATAPVHVREGVVVGNLDGVYRKMKVVGNGYYERTK